MRAMCRTLGLLGLVVVVVAAVVAVGRWAARSVAEWLLVVAVGLVVWGAGGGGVVVVVVRKGWASGP